MTADCLPALFGNQAGTERAAAHAGWPGLREGVLEETVAAWRMIRRTFAPAWPAIGPGHSRSDRKSRCLYRKRSQAVEAFVSWREISADISELAGQRLKYVGVEIFGGDRGPSPKR
ncbi:laccase domain-containing protein [Shigella flexneri]